MNRSNIHSISVNVNDVICSKIPLVHSSYVILFPNNIRFGKGIVVKSTKILLMNDEINFVSGIFIHGSRNLDSTLGISGKFQFGFTRNFANSFQDFTLFAFK